MFLWCSLGSAQDRKWLRTSLGESSHVEGGNQLVAVLGIGLAFVCIPYMRAKTSHHISTESESVLLLGPLLVSGLMSGLDHRSFHMLQINFLAGEVRAGRGRAWIRSM